MKRAVIPLLGLWLMSCGSPEPRRFDFKVVVLGFDGVDPDLVRDWLAELPNIQELGGPGTLRDLGSTNPPESPVAWASFATGLNPGKHGIFDFLRRDPETYFPDIGLVSIERAKFFLGLPIQKPKIENNRRGIPFWKHLDQQGVSSVNLRMPLEFPPNELSHGTITSGLGLPDIRGTWGTYFYLASDLSRWDVADTEFGGRQIRLEVEEKKMTAVLDGPTDPRRDDFQRLGIPLEFELDENSSAVTIRMQGQQETVSEGRWSDWFSFEYSVGPLVSLRGISRFYVLETFPEVRIYLSPISVDPRDPALPISSPESYSKELAERFGLYKTLGWIHETWSLNEEQIDEQLFLEDLFRNMNNLEAFLLAELDAGNASLYSTVFTATDSVSHMFYRLLDPTHPRYDPALAVRYGDSILRVYQKMDSIIGEVRKRLRPQDILLVVSDHGFHSWRKEFNTNTWLVRNGYLALQGVEQDDQLARLDLMFSGGSFFPNVDWTRSRAYAVGLGQIYVNLKGREKLGTVEPGAEYQQLVEEIRTRILQFQDPDNGEQVLQNAYLRDEIYQGDQIGHSGDLVISFRTGYRTSWQTALGAVPENILVANLKKWSGDHCASDVSQTSGFLVSNRRIDSEDVSIMDIAPTLYSLFGASLPDGLDGRPWNLNRPSP